MKKLLFLLRVLPIILRDPKVRKSFIAMVLSISALAKSLGEFFKALAAALVKK